jgi:DNA-binding NarL/FixJ family response regulator
VERQEKRLPQRVLLLQSQAELRQYTTGLLTEMGVRHVLPAQDLEQARRLLEGCREAGQRVDLLVCDDGVTEGGALMALPLLGDSAVLVISDAQNPRNTRLAARLGIGSLLFRPYGAAKLAAALARVSRK